MDGFCWNHQPCLQPSCLRFEISIFKQNHLFISLCLGVILTVIAKVFRQADTEELGQVDPTIVPGLAMKVLGSGVKDTEKQMIHFKAQEKAGMLLFSVCCTLSPIPE